MQRSTVNQAMEVTVRRPATDGLACLRSALNCSRYVTQRARRGVAVAVVRPVSCVAEVGR